MSVNSAAKHRRPEDEGNFAGVCTCPEGLLFGIKVVLGGLRSVVCLGGILILLHVLGRVSLPALVLSEARCCCVKS